MDVIGELLRTSLLSEIGDDQERARRVRNAARRLGEDLAHGSRPLVPHCVVAAIDETGNEDSVVLRAAAAAVLEEWETFRNAFPKSPVELLRAVTLAGITTAADTDPAVRHAAWYSMRTALECLPAGRWRPVAETLLAEWDSATAGDIAAVWTPGPGSEALRMPAIPSPSGAGTAVSADGLVEKATAMAKAGNYNQFASQLQTEFEGFVNELVQLAGVAATEADKRTHALLKEFAGQLGAKLRGTLAAVERDNEASRLRIELLWWRQTAYSERLSRPYADLEAPAAVAEAAAVDLHAQVPDLAPVVVEHLLADLVGSVTADARVDAASLAVARSETGLEPVEAAATPAVLLDLATGAAATSPLVRDGQSLSAARAAVLLFRDLQARRLTPPGATAEPEPSVEKE